jgi:hypothetical protein
MRLCFFAKNTKSLLGEFDRAGIKGAGVTAIDTFCEVVSIVKGHLAGS